MLLLTSPLTQLNTPYPATAYLAGFLRSQGISVAQGDLGLDLFLRIFSRQGLTRVFDAMSSGSFNLDDAAQTVLNRRDQYLDTIEPVIAFLQHKQPTLAHRIVRNKYLPAGTRFQDLEQRLQFMGDHNVYDTARFLATLYIEDLIDAIGQSVGPHLELTRYAERIARTAVSFSPIESELQAPNTLIDNMLWECVAAYFKEPHDVVGFSVPFSGNLYGALKSAQWIRQNHPNTKIIMGGGYVNTELRDLRDPRVFDYLDYILVDDGEGPLLALLDHLKQGGALKRTFCREHGAVVYHSGSMLGEPGHNNLPAPDYSGLRLTEYLSMFDNPNPMHRLWNDGRWNKLTVAHGCYWKRCSFCDISLDYIGRYENSQAATFVDKMEALIRQTGETGFHFVDEAAPPLALRDIALEIIRRGLQVTWWTNIRFEKTFTPDLCRVLSISGCIAVTGGLEVASDRLLALMEKGVTIEQVARVCKGFTDAGILVHAYLMYGFPTQTEQETIDSLEVVRQLFENQLIQSGFWHRFAMTAHSPVGKHPEAYQVICTGPEFEGFANNDLYHEDPTGADHELYGSGLTAALYNYLHGNALDMDVTDFFDFKVPATTIHKNLIFSHINNFIPDDVRRDDLFVYRYRLHIEVLPFSKREAQVTFTHARGEDQVVMPIEAARYLEELANLPELGSTDRLPLKSMLEGMAECIQKDPAEVILEPWWRQLRKSVLLVLRF